MCKKLVVTLLLVFGAVVFLRSEHGRELVRELKNKRWSSKHCGSLEREIARLRGDLKRLDSDDRTDVHNLAVKEQQIDKLKTKIKDLENIAVANKRIILTLREDLKTGQQLIKYGDNEYSSNEVKGHLARVFTTYKRDVEELKSLRSMLQEQQLNLQAAHDALTAKRNQRRDLEIKLIQLETKLYQVRREQMKHRPIEISDRKQERIRSAIQKVEDRVDLESRKLRLEERYLLDLSREKVETEKVTEDVLEEIDRHFKEKDVVDND